ncbi:MAG: 3-phosphoshikimate 1-carboxyvinyltransferase [Nitrospirota bacterium]|nr:3-phosphoshikimate 1-carboxyvinyltransferase [Nitrospirota bacterium]
MSSLTMTPGCPLKGAIHVPGDKSVTHRAIMLTALAEGLSTVTGYCRGEDCLNTMRAFQSLGVRIEETADRLQVHGKGMWGLTEPFNPIDCGNSGTGIRLMTGLLAGQDFFTVLTGDESIRRRPMGRVVKPLRTMGATIAGRKGGELAPVAITGTRLKGISYTSPVASAQIKSSLLFAALYADGTTTITEPRLSRDHTERMLVHFGIPLRRDGCTVQIDGRPSARWSGKAVVVPGDLSAAAFFIVGASIVPDSDVTLRAVGINPTRTGLLDILRHMGAHIDVLDPREEAGEPVADLRVRSRPLRGVRIGPEQIPQTIDEFPILCVAAAVAEGETVITGAEELRVKESDRLATMASELRAMGASIEERPDGMVIQGLGRQGANGTLTGATCTSHGDHRVAMSVAIGALTAAEPTLIQDTACIETSFPGFDRTLSELLTDSEKRL